MVVFTYNYKECEVSRGEAFRQGCPGQVFIEVDTYDSYCARFERSPANAGGAPDIVRVIPLDDYAAPRHEDVVFGLTEVAVRYLESSVDEKRSLAPVEASSISQVAEECGGCEEAGNCLALGAFITKVHSVRVENRQTA
ncbi:hypothetical protein BH23PAT1_BH23PAT1_2570 [soil metagenome]